MSFSKSSLVRNAAKKSAFCGIFLTSCIAIQAAEPISAPSRRGPYQIHDGVRKEVTPPSGPRLNDWSCWTLNLDVIAWQPRMENLAFAYGGVLPSSVGLTTSAIPQGHKEDLSYRYKPGFKVGFGLDFRHDGWDTDFNYTWYQQVSATGSAQTNPDTPNLIAAWLDPTITTLSSNNNLYSANADWRTRYNIIDWELGRGSFLSKYLTLRPFFGLKAAFLYSMYKINYFFEAPSTVNQIRIVNNLDFRGLGLRGGFNAAWLFASSWGFYGDLAVSALWGQYIISRQDYSYPSPTSARSQIVNVQDYSHAVKPVIEVGGGVQWQTWFYRNKWRLTVKAGWEEQIWINYNQMIRFEGISGGDMTLEGLTVSAKMDF